MTIDPETKTIKATSTEWEDFLYDLSKLLTTNTIKVEFFDKDQQCFTLRIEDDI